MARPSTLLVALILLSFLGPAPCVLAQEAGPGATGEVDLGVAQFGVGQVCRPGELVGVQLTLQDRLTRPRAVLLRAAIPDADGDLAQYQVSVATSPGQKQRIWMYFRLPFSAASNPLFEFQAFEQTGGDGDGPPRAGRRIGSYVYRVQGAEMAPPAAGLMAQVGRQPLNLDRYTVRTTGSNNCLPFGHEVVHTISQLVPGTRGAPGELPDRWYGLAQFDAIVWSGYGTGGEPTDLSPSQAEAIREWVERGGHLIVILPPAGQSWLGARDNPLTAIMPRVVPRRLEAVDLEPMRALLVGVGKRYEKRTLPKNQIVNIFEREAGVDPAMAHRLFVTPDGKCIVTRRLVGIGAVTLIGLDLTSNQLLKEGGVEPDVFWHRVLGRRGVLVDQGTLARGAASGGRSNWFIDSRARATLDGGIQSQISKTAAAAAGVLLAFVVFVAYWVLAGPLGFAVLKRRNLAQHGWLSFVLAAGIFTAIAWGGATAMRPLVVSAVHLSFVDHVYGQDTDRARTFASVLLPRYGEMNVSVREPDSRFHHGLYSWDAPAATSGAGGFPDTRGYAADARGPDTADFPSRSTTKNIQVDWAGGPRWKMPAPVVETAPNQYAAGGRLELDPGAPAGAGIVRGILVHDLPVALTNVTIVVVEGQNLALETQSDLTASGMPRQPGRLPGRVHAWAFPSAFAWAPGQPMDLGLNTLIDRGSAAEDNYLRTLLPTIGGMIQDYDDTTGANEREIERNLTALAFFPMIEPPSFSPGGGRFGNDQQTLVVRQATHGLDLARWFTQPCVIIVGHMGGKDVEGTLPVPLQVDVADAERATASPMRRVTGRTILRWVYPLPEAPPAFPKDNPSDTAVPAP